MYPDILVSLLLLNWKNMTPDDFVVEESRLCGRLAPCISASVQTWSPLSKASSAADNG